LPTQNRRKKNRRPNEPVRENFTSGNANDQLPVDWDQTPGRKTGNPGD